MEINLVLMRKLGFVIGKVKKSIEDLVEVE